MMDEIPTETNTGCVTHLDFATLHRSKATQSIVKKALRDYLRFVSANPNATDNWLLMIQPQYLEENSEDVFCDLISYIRYLNEDKRNAPNTIRLKLHYTKAWLECNNFHISKTNERLLRNIQPRAVTVMEETELTREIILRIVKNADMVTRTIITLLASSGMRISEALGILTNDIKFGKYVQLKDGGVIRIPGEIHISHERMKAGKSHVYYISEESENLIKEYLQIRNQQNNEALKRGKHSPNCLEDNRIFQISYGTATKRLIIAEKAAGVYEWSEKGKRSKITFHAIRKWTESTMKLHIPINMANELIGHDEGLSAHYRRYSKQQMQDAYRIVEPYLVLEGVRDEQTICDSETISSSFSKAVNTLSKKQEEIMRKLNEIEDLLVRLI